MIWAQAAVSFALWVIYGIWFAQRAANDRRRFACMCSVRRKVYAPLLMVSGAALLLAGFAALVAFEGLGPNGLRSWAWAAVSALGLGFVHAQATATAMILSLVDIPVTTEHVCAFESKETQSDDCPTLL